MPNIPTINVKFETDDGKVRGSTDAQVKRVEAEDDGSFTVVVNHWPEAAGDTSNRILLREYWASFCDADPFPGSDMFADRMEAAGLIELVPVTKEALEDNFAAERGIEPGGMMYRLTDVGRAAYTDVANPSPQTMVSAPTDT